MTSQYASLYCVNNRLLCKQIIDDITGRAAARSDQKINRQLPQASARLHQRKKADSLDLHSTVVRVNLVIDISVLATTNWCFFAFLSNV